MKAIIQNQYGSPDVLVPGMTNPPLVSDHDVLVEIYASTVTQGDRRLSLRLIPRRLPNISAPLERVASA